MKRWILPLLLGSAIAYGSVDWGNHSIKGNLDVTGTTTLTGAVTAPIKLPSGTNSAPSLTFSTDTSTDSGMYRSAEDTVDFVAGSFVGLQLKKSTGNFANVGMGGAASVSDNVLLSLERTNSSSGSSIYISNPSTSANAFGGLRVVGDNGNVAGALNAYTDASTVDAFDARVVLRTDSSGKGLVLLASGAAPNDVKIYNGGGATTNENVRFNADYSMQLMQTIATPATPASNTLKMYVKNDKLYTLNDAGSELELGSGSGGGSAGINILSAYNPKAEAGATTNWTESGGGTLDVTSTAANVGNNTYSFSYDASANNDYAASTAVTVPAGLFGQNCLLEFRYKGFDSNITAQVHDGTNPLASQVLSASTLYSAPVQITFPCPASGTLEMRLLATGDAAIGYWDEVHLGSASNISNVSQAAFAGESYFAGTTNCAGWTRNSTTVGAFATDADCPGPTVVRSTLGTWATTDSNLPRQTITNLPPGIYKATFSGIPASSSTGVTVFAIHDGTTTCEPSHAVNDSIRTEATVSCTFEYTAAQSSVSFELYSATASGAITISPDTTAPRNSLRFQLERYPLASDVGINYQLTPWRVDASISGANPTLGGSAVTSYTAITNSGLTLVNNAEGTATAQIACATTTEAEGTTCNTAAVNEGIGIAFTIPRAGTYEACTAFAHAIGINSGSNQSNSTFQLVETPNNAQTISQSGKDRVQNGATGGGTDGVTNQTPIQLCGTFTFTSAGKKTIRLMYEQSVGGSGAATNTILADAGASNGDRDIHFTVRPLDQQFNMPNIINSVATSSSGATKMETALINCDAGASITSQNGNWVASVANISSGACTVTLNAGVFSATPHCVATQNAGSRIPRATPASTTSVVLGCTTDAGAACTDHDTYVICIGAR